MSDFIIAAGSAFGFGVLTSISPCSMAMNVTAISYVSRRFGNVRWVFLSALLYIAGQTLAYCGLALALIATARSVPLTSMLFQRYMHLFLGPFLTVIGMFLLQLIPSGAARRGISAAAQKNVDALGAYGAFLLGAFVALTFCPTSASYYFGALIPLAVKTDSALLVPIIYGIGAALPVMLLASLLALSAQALGRTYNMLGTIERWARVVAGLIFVLSGIYFSLKYIFEVI
jgi:cytochrome c-type biogenesis protein